MLFSAPSITQINRQWIAYLRRSILFHDEINRVLRNDFEPGTISDVISLLCELGIDSWALVTGLAEQPNASPTSFLTEYIDTSGRGQTESPGETIVAACLRVQNASKYTMNMSKRHARNFQMAKETTPVVLPVLKMYQVARISFYFLIHRRGLLRGKSIGTKNHAVPPRNVFHHPPRGVSGLEHTTVRTMTPSRLIGRVTCWWNLNPGIRKRLTKNPNFT